ncbi:MAG: DUF4157 domain-containing protein [Bacteroidota bacterium]
MEKEKLHHKKANADLAGKNGAALQAKTQYPVQRSAESAIESVKNTAGTVLKRDFSDISIQLNSPDPGKMGAVATAQGKNVKIAPSHSDLTQRKNVEVAGHELRHTQQQAEGKVRANTKIGNVPMNTEKRHEGDADAAGRRVANAM